MNRVTCEEAFRQLDDYLDRELSAEGLRLVEEHLAICAGCLREFTFERSVVQGVRRRLRQAVGTSDLMARISTDLVRAAREIGGTE